MPVVFWKRLMSALALAGILGMGFVLYGLYESMGIMHVSERQRVGTLHVVDELRNTSHSLTNDSRSRVAFGEVAAKERYQHILNVRNGTQARSRDIPLYPGRTMSLLQVVDESSFNADERQLFLDVLDHSEKLTLIEQEAIRLAETAEIEAGAMARAAHPAITQATDLLFNRSYQNEIDQIQARLAMLVTNLTSRMGAEEDTLLNRMNLLITMLCSLFLLTGVCLVVTGYLGQAGSAARGGNLRLYAYIILALVISLGIPIVFVYTDARELMIGTLEKRQSLIAREVSRELNLRMAVTVELADIVSARPAVQRYLAEIDAGNDVKDSVPLMSELLNSVTKGYTAASRTFLLNSRGEAVICTSGAEAEAAMLRLEPVELAKLKSGKAFMTNLRLPSGAREVTVLSPVMVAREGRSEFLGAVLSVMNRRNAFRLWEDLLVTEERMHIFIIDQEGRVVLSSRGVEFHGQSALEETAGKLILGGATGLHYYRDALDVDRVGYFLPVTDLNWTVGVSSAYSSSTATLHSMLVRAMIFGSTSILVAIFLFTLLMQRMTRNLRNAQARTQNLMRTVGMFIWEIDMPGNRFEYDAAWHRFIQFPGEAESGSVSLDEHCATIHPDDIERIRELLAAAATPAMFEFELRHRCNDGVYRWVRVMASADLRDAEGRPLALSGMGYDITAQKVVEASEAELKQLASELHSANERMESVIQVARMLTFDFDVAHGIFLHNAEWMRVWRFPGPEEAGCKRVEAVSDRVHPDYWHVFTAIFANRSPGDMVEVELLMRTYDEEWRWHRHQIKIEACDENGQVLHAIGVGFDITAQKLAEQSDAEQKQHLESLVALRTVELEESRNQAQAASEAKTSFLSTVSHEIRTPMNAIVGFIHLFERGNLTQVQKDQLDKIRLSAGTLLGIINDVLDISKIEAGRLELEYRPFRLRSLLDAVSSIVGFAAVNKGLPVHVRVADNVPERLVGDDKRISQILLNLMNNAVKFTHEGQVSLEVTLLESSEPGYAQLWFQVDDTGIGLTEEQMSRLFKPFMQADSSVTRRFGGTGLGLAISRQLVEIMNGSIGVRSTYGKGATFHFTLRLAMGAEDEEVFEGDVKIPAEVGIDSQAKWDRVRGARVLVVEDNEINQEIARSLLEECGVLVDVAENGQSALECVQQTRYACIFMDMQMPVMDGLQATVEIRALGTAGLSGGTDAAWLAQVPIVAMTANAMAEDRQRCLDVGMNDHLGKPIEPLLLQQCLVRWVVRDDAQ